MRFEQLTSKANLRLAWRRITTGKNHQYKRYFRELYYAYETALDDNLRDLSRRLRGGSYRPKKPIRVYTPKASGLQRPLSLLFIEDQIVYQAIANRVALRICPNRRALEQKTIFSNICNGPNAIFFMKGWQAGYHAFQKKIESHFKTGRKWIAHFDLAAFYDTISHSLLLQAVCPRNGHAESREVIEKWLRTWSTENAAYGYGHGIPQGPIASDFLAECVLLPIDKALSNEFHYVRYVDDIRLFGEVETEVRQAAIRMEVMCRERGLIPQGKKYAIAQARSIADAMGALPSLPPPSDPKVEKPIILMPSKDAVEKFRSALSKTRPKFIEDKARVRHVLYHGWPSPKLLSLVLKFMPRHPEHIDAFTYYLSNYARSPRIIAACAKLLHETPYEYVQGELFHVLARMMKASEMRGCVLKKAVDVARDARACFAIKWGACHLLCRAEAEGLGRYARFLLHQKHDLLLALLAPQIPPERYVKDDVAASMLKRESFEPGIALTDHLVRLRKTPRILGVQNRDLRSQVQNVYRHVGIIGRRTGTVDPMGEILAARYGIGHWQKWRMLFGGEYGHALQLLGEADPVFYSGRSPWLYNQNSFNHALFLAVQTHLHKLKAPGAVTLMDRNGCPVKFGVMVGPAQPFARTFPALATAFWKANDRRNSLPSAHPYSDKGGARTRYLTKNEQKDIAADLKTAYAGIIQHFDPIL